MTTTTTVKPSCAAGHHGQAGRACSQCGVTKTPQWREGPLGPKTLCNACGVKRVRQARAALEGRSPRAGKTSAASGGTKKHQSEVSTRRRAKGKSKAARAAAFILAAIEHQDSEAEMQASVKALFALDPDATAHNSTPFDQVR